ncbi:hypothetical protein AAFF_G00042120 [Aldrovandia affinis]|uniref:Uncharacterized protein n=1 Tax=Aldrovandia affinis TaxID=143900 RepID=A0AAD7WF76_9TELE|nr:hypothetical protein AAFF_G00042120 [Aldrovandia affinis]
MSRTGHGSYGSRERGGPQLGAPYAAGGPGSPPPLTQSAGQAVSTPRPPPWRTPRPSINLRPSTVAWPNLVPSRPQVALAREGGGDGSTKYTKPAIFGKGEINVVTLHAAVVQDDWLQTDRS